MPGPAPDALDPLKQTVKLKQRLYQQRGTPRFTIILPEWAKNIEDANFKALWKNAERAIRNAETIALVGFSFTPTDLHVESLFRLALADNSALKSVIIANPNAARRRRIRGVFSGALRDDVIIRQYDELSDLSEAFERSSW
jgi:hypothetical protein